MQRVLLLALLLAVGCASLPAKQRAVVTLNASEMALEASHDAERAFCSPTSNPAEPITHCDGAGAAAIGLTDARHQALARLYARAFAAQILAAEALQAWRSGDPAPTSFAGYQAVVAEIIAAVVQLWPSTDAVVTRAQEASVAAADTARLIGGSR